MGLYSYKVDKNTDTVLPDLIDKNNHCIDALRYALSEYIQCGIPLFDEVRSISRESASTSSGWGSVPGHGTTVGW